MEDQQILQKYPLTAKDIARETGRTTAAIRSAGQAMDPEMATHLSNNRWYFAETAISFIQNRKRGRYRELPPVIQFNCPMCDTTNSRHMDGGHNETRCTSCGKKLLT